MAPRCPHCGSKWDLCRTDIFLTHGYKLQDKDGEPFIADDAEFEPLDEPIQLYACSCGHPSMMGVCKGGCIMIGLSVWDMGSYDGFTNTGKLQPGDYIYRGDA